MREEKYVVAVPSLVIFAVLILAALLSVAFPGRHYANPESYSSSVEALNEKKSGVEKLAGAAAAASATITLMPGDFGTPIADKLADLSGYFLVILIAIYVERFLVSVSGILAFDVLIPIGLVLLAVGMFFDVPYRKTALRMISLGVILVALIPLSLRVSNMIEQQYAPEIQEAVDAATQNTEDLKGTADRSEDSSPWSEFISKVRGGSAAILERLESVLNNFIDAIAIYIVTTCVVPIVILLLGVWLVKCLFHLDFEMPRIGTAASHFSRKFRDTIK